MVVFAAVGLLVSAACSGDDEPADPGDDPLEGGVSELPGEGEADGGGAADEVTRDVEALLDEYNRTVNAIIADPSVVDDPDAPIVAAYVDLFEPDSPLAADALEAWAQQAAEGVTVQPVNDEHPALVSRLDGEVEVLADDEVRFPTCDEHRYVLLDAEGAIDELVERTLQHGEGTAVRVDGQWRLRDLRNLVDGQGCRNEGDA